MYTGMRAVWGRGGTPERPQRAAWALMIGLSASLALAGCSRDKLARQGQVTQDQADNYVNDAIRQSSEGVVLDPSQVGLEQIERTRLSEIAQELRRPAALCFLERAIVTMEMGEIDGERTWVDVPEGQVKIRARVSVDGSVLTTDVLESGFEDPKMVTCLEQVISKQGFVESRDTFAYYIDIYYWVSLGFFAEAQSASFAELLRRRQTEAGVRAKGCLTGRVNPGEYVVSGLNLFDRAGQTLINRIDRGELPPEVSSCVASSLKRINIHPEPDAFVRPAAPEIRFVVADDGSITVTDERWLELIELEERALRDQRKAELLETPIGADRSEDDGVGPYIDRPEPLAPKDSIDALPRGVDPSAVKPEPAKPEPAKPEPAKPEPAKPEPAKPEPPATKPEPAPPQGDPSKPGTKIDLSPRR